jgi:hypothetical protein
MHSENALDQYKTIDFYRLTILSSHNQPGAGFMNRQNAYQKVVLLYWGGQIHREADVITKLTKGQGK